MENTIMLQSSSCALRWINCQCFEIKLPNGKTILTDPCYDYPENAGHPVADLFRLKGFTTDDLEGCDYLILNHTHGDHIANLEEVIMKFNPVVICHSGVAAEIAEVCQDMPLTSIYAVNYDGTYFFDGFKLETFHGVHKPQKFTWRQSMAEGDDISQQPKLTRLHTLGGLFNMNYMLTMENGFRLAFVGGMDDGMAQRLPILRPNVVLRNKITNDRDVEKVAGDWYDFMKESYAQVVIPMHFEVWENMEPGFSKQTFDYANKMAEESGLNCCMLAPRRTEWYCVQMVITKRNQKAEQAVTDGVHVQR